MTKLMIVVASTRPGRIGLPIAEWVQRKAEADGRFEIDFADLAEIKLPFMDEPSHPRLKQYVHQHTKDWSARVEAAEAFVFVQPEYNYTFTAPLKNAIDFLHQEWYRKPITTVSYGGNSSGTRSVVGLRPALAAVGLVPTVPNVEIGFPAKFVDDESVFTGTEQHDTVIAAAFNELAAISAALAPVRAH